MCFKANPFFRCFAQGQFLGKRDSVFVLLFPNFPFLPYPIDLEKWRQKVGWERERETDTERDRDTETEKQTERERQKQKERKRDRE